MALQYTGLRACIFVYVFFAVPPTSRSEASQVAKIMTEYLLFTAIVAISFTMRLDVVPAFFYSMHRMRLAFWTGDNVDSRQFPIAAYALCHLLFALHDPWSLKGGHVLKRACCLSVAP